MAGDLAFFAEFLRFDAFLEVFGSPESWEAGWKGWWALLLLRGWRDRRERNGAWGLSNSIASGVLS